jgi:hypothetical protein
VSESNPVTQRSAEKHPAGAIAVFSRDVFFGMRIRTVVQALGYALSISSEIPAFVSHLNDVADLPVLALVDFNQPVDWSQLAPVLASGVPVVAFGSHTDVDGFRAAKAAGVARVVSNGEFSRSLADLVAKYARA